jgi:hypothetical protein
VIEAISVAAAIPVAADEISVVIEAIPEFDVVQQLRD